MFKRGTRSRGCLLALSIPLGVLLLVGLGFGINEGPPVVGGLCAMVLGVIAFAYGRAYPRAMEEAGHGPGSGLLTGGWQSVIGVVLFVVGAWLVIKAVVDWLV